MELNKQHILTIRIFQSVLNISQTFSFLQSY